MVRTMGHDPIKKMYWVGSKGLLSRRMCNVLGGGGNEHVK